jgi:hypothetical protein
MAGHERRAMTASEESRSSPCTSTVASPWPESTAALWTSTRGPSAPADDVTLASHQSSNPSPYRCS